ncbi:methyltransferase domain-containing protein [Chloroflexota bacterium]
MWYSLYKRWLGLNYVLTKDARKLAKDRYKQFKEMLNILAPYIGEVKRKTILDVGCGELYPFTLLLHNMRNTVTGIDTVYVDVDSPVYKRYWTTIRMDGYKRFVESFLLEILFKKRAFYEQLQNLCDFPLTTNSIDIRHMSVEEMDFSEKTFDIVISNAVFEHIRNVPQALSEINRVLKPGGIAYAYIHLFTSLSGGHHPNWQDFNKVPPWDHLRQKKFPLNDCLNRLREHEYISLFQHNFEIIQIKYIEEKEPKDLLYPEIRAELGDYSEEELLKRGIMIVAQKSREKSS